MNNCMGDNGPNPFTANIPCAAAHNCAYRSAYWTGEYLQMTLMCIPPCGEIGAEVHCDTDQCIRVESGCCVAVCGPRKDCLVSRRCLRPGDVFFVPAGTWHNVLNTGRCPLRLSSIYAPPEHKPGTVHLTKADSDQAGH